MPIDWYDSAVNAETALLNSGTIKIYAGSQPAEDAALGSPTLLATLTFSSTAFGSSASGTATANAIASGTAVASGTAGWFAFFKSDGTTVVGTGTCGVSGSGADLILASTTITSGVTVSCTGFSIVG